MFIMIHSQKSTETMFDFIRHIKEVFQTAFGHEKLSIETRDTYVTI